MRPRQFLSNVLNAIGGAISPSPVSIVAQRFVKVFQDHGVDPAQIPRLLPELDLSTINSEDALLQSLTPDLLDRVARLFGIRVEWLEGIDDRVYEYLAYYKEPRILLEQLSELAVGKDILLGFPLRILTTERNLDRNDSSCGYMAPVLVEEIADLSEETICRYHIYQDGIDWSYLPTRLELKAIARIAAMKLRIVIPLHVISDKEMEEVLAGRMIPRRFLAGCQITSPSLEDYVLSKEESLVAREVDELPAVMSYIEKNRLHEIEFCVASDDHGAPRKSTDLPPLDYEPSDQRSPTTLAEKESAVSVEHAWKIKARSIADELDELDAKCGAHDSKRNLAERVATKLREQGVHGPHGPLSGSTIMREALQGTKWKRKR